MRKTLLKEHKRAIKRIKPLIEEGEFYLAGGTAVFYYLNHRNSIDLDFFTFNEIDLRKYQKLFATSELNLISKDTLHAVAEGINVSFFYYPYSLLKPLTRLEIINIASLEDILCMKIGAVISRGSRKDFIDIYFIMKNLKINAKEAITLFKKKYGECNDILIRKAMVFFEDAEKEPEIATVKRVSWEKVKKFFEDNFAKLEV